MRLSSDDYTRFYRTELTKFELGGVKWPIVLIVDPTGSVWQQYRAQGFQGDSDAAPLVLWVRLALGSHIAFPEDTAHDESRFKQSGKKTPATQ